MCVFSMVTACGKKLFLSLVLILIDLYHLPKVKHREGRMGAVVEDAVEAAEKVHIL